MTHGIAHGQYAMGHHGNAMVAHGQCHGMPVYSRGIRGVALFGPKVSDRLSSSSDELPVSLTILMECCF